MEATKNSYLEKLRDPRWQKRKADVCEAANWTCQDCGATDKNLHVHHKRYLKDHAGKLNEPWDYSETDLVCVCFDCHAMREQVAASSRILFQQMHPSIAMAFLGTLSKWGNGMEAELAHLVVYMAAHLESEGRNEKRNN